MPQHHIYIISELFLVFMNLPVIMSVHNILTFLEYLHTDPLSPKVIKNYLSSISSMTKQLKLYPSNFYRHMEQKYLSIAINSQFAPTPTDIFDIITMYCILIFCDILSHPILFRPIFLTASHSLSKFLPDKYFLYRELMFSPPGAHSLIKRTKTLQERYSLTFLS